MYEFVNCVRKSYSWKRLYTFQMKFLCPVAAVHSDTKPNIVVGLSWWRQQMETGHRWIPLTKASDAELWRLFWSVPE